MNNIKFIYLYRDGANFKSWGEVIFENPEQLALTEIERRLTNAFLPDKLFIANQISVPEKFMFLDGTFTTHDHCYHEFDCVEVCNEKPTDRRSISDVLFEVEMVTKQGWKAFDILTKA